ncbi:MULTISPECIES: energy transducer TonB [Sphingobacterium]|uniref:energy transducer TonB n=1 Tax=Sphingobacterium TaxID=28453 RepID=UPI0013D9702F|nr:MULTISPECIES: energy transducer TonB [unclassified Sphingobacterium]
MGTNYKYPLATIKQGTTGTVRIAFVVEKDGNIADLKVEEDMGHDTGVAAIAVIVREMASRGNAAVPIRVQFNLPYD